MDKLNFNTLDNLVASDHWHEMVNQASQSIKAMQTDVLTPTISPHAVLPVFQRQEEGQYVLAVQGEQRGPFSLTQIKQMLKTEVINGDYYIWTNGWTKWKFIKECSEIIGGINNG